MTFYAFFGAGIFKGVVFKLRPPRDVWPPQCKTQVWTELNFLFTFFSNKQITFFLNMIFERLNQKG